MGGLVDNSIERKIVKDYWWLKCLSGMVKYYDITPDDENPYANGYTSLLSDDELKKRASLILGGI